VAGEAWRRGMASAGAPRARVRKVQLALSYMCCKRGHWHMGVATTETSKAHGGLGRPHGCGRREDNRQTIPRRGAPPRVGAAGAMWDEVRPAPAGVASRSHSPQAAMVGVWSGDMQGGERGSHRVAFVHIALAPVENRVALVPASISSETQDGRHERAPDVRAGSRGLTVSDGRFSASDALEAPARAFPSRHPSSHPQASLSLAPFPR
jgi:hypothetical protein